MITEYEESLSGTVKESLENCFIVLFFALFSSIPIVIMLIFTYSCFVLSARCPDNRWNEELQKILQENESLTREQLADRIASSIIFLYAGQ